MDAHEGEQCGSGVPTVIAIAGLCFLALGAFGSMDSRRIQQRNAEQIDAFRIQQAEMQALIIEIRQRLPK